MASRPAATSTRAAFARIEAKLAAEQAVILDGGVATELERRHQGELKASDRGLWGTGALYQAPRAVLDVHRRYAEIGCDVVSTDTWAILGASELEAGGMVGRAGATHWMDVARLGLRLARQAVAEAGREGECAVAFTVNGDFDSPERLATLELLLRVLADEPPDILFLETAGLIREGLTYEGVELALGSGVPVWLSFRRCRHGVCGVYGQHWGGPEGDLFGRAARRFEELGVKALLINCLPPDHVEGMLPWLRDFTDLPLGVYPNLGYYGEGGWRFDERVGPEDYAQLALRWREEGAQIVGGCCGTSPAHIAAAARALEGTKPGRPKARPLTELAFEAEQRPVVAPEPWTDELGRVVFPLPFPEIIREPDVFVPTQGSLLVWKYLWRNRLGEGKKCLDVGCGSGLLAIQLALNGARDVLAVDIQRQAVANTLANAYRNGVHERVRGEVVDIYTVEPTERFDLVVASLYQMPVDPFSGGGHRPLDYWGRNLVDHFLALVPSLLEEDGVAYLMQLSIIGQQRTAERLQGLGLKGRVVDYGFFFFNDVFQENAEQIRRVEQLSDAYHLDLGGEDVMVAYLVEITRTAPSS
jgi:S-methylmethionine-dependent homocysteine/selenocysteine methylase/SAM-dependent methyltransferase